MRLIASLVVRNEFGRYLEMCIPHLLTFCDEVVVLDDASEDGTSEYLADVDDRVVKHRRTQAMFFRHEGRTRQQLLDMTLQRKPTHVLAVDADEFVAHGPAVRALLVAEPDARVVRLSMEEVWQAHPDRLLVREDGGWRSHPVPIVWRVPDRYDARWRIVQRQLACGRLPMGAQRLPGVDGGSLLHFGWAEEAGRAARYARYQTADRGRFHAAAHLESIMWPDEKVTLRDRPWPTGPVFDELRRKLCGEDDVLELVNGTGQPVARINKRTGERVA